MSDDTASALLFVQTSVLKFNVKNTAPGFTYSQAFDQIIRSDKTVYVHFDVIRRCSSSIQLLTTSVVRLINYSDRLSRYLRLSSRLNFNSYILTSPHVNIPHFTALLRQLVYRNLHAYDVDNTARVWMERLPL